MEKYINSKGRKIIGWDEILEGGLAPNATVMSWRGEAGGIEAAKQNHDVVMTPSNFMYFDHAQTKSEDSVTIGNYTSLEETYSFEPIPKELDSTKAKFVLGGQANVWTEYMKNTRKVEYQIFPRMSALCEVLWSPKQRRNYSDFEKRLPKQINRYQLWGANYSKAYFDIQSTISRAPGNEGVLWKLETKSKAPIFVTYTATNTGMKYAEPILINGSGDIEATVVDSNKVISTLKQRYSFNKATGRKLALVTPPSTQYAGNGGEFGLVNGVVSDRGFNSPEWLGFNGKNMDAYIDLEKPQTVSSVTIDVWKQEPSWVYLPKQVDVYTSANGNEWNPVTTITPDKNIWPNERKITVELKDKPTARYIRVVAHNYGTIPEGRPGAGKAPYLFVDEIEIN
jgi:hexosaminidase